MNLLERIQEGAVDAGQDLATLLRKCKLLASRLESRRLEDWVLWESNGYPADIEVPDYRVLSLQLKGHFAGPFGSGIHNAPIPLVCLPEAVRESYSKYRCRQSVASIEEMVGKADTANLQVSTGDLAVTLGTNVYESQNCIQAWAEVPIGQLVELLNTVRNRILDFATAVWKEAPTAGEANPGHQAVIQESRLTQIFNTTVHGGSASLVGSASDSVVTFDLRGNDFGELANLLREHGVSETDVRDLEAALEAEPEGDRQGSFGPRVAAWIGKMVGKAASGAWQISAGAAGKLLGEALTKYYGW